MSCTCNLKVIALFTPCRVLTPFMSHVGKKGTVATDALGARIEQLQSTHACLMLCQAGSIVHALHLRDAWNNQWSSRCLQQF